MSRAHSYSHSRAHSPSFQSPHLSHSSFWFSKLSVTSPTSQLILQPFPRSFSKLLVSSPTSQLILILQASHHFTYVTAHYPTLPSLYLRHSSFYNPSLALPTSQLILQPFFHFYVTGFSLTSPDEPPMQNSPTQHLKSGFFISKTLLWRHFKIYLAHSPIIPSLHLRHSSFSNPSLALLTSQLFLQPFRCFTYVAAHSPTILSLLLRHRIFTYVTWRAAHGSEALILAWGSFTCCKSTTRDPRLYFPSDGSHSQDFYALRKMHRPRPGLNPRTSDPEESVLTPRPPGSTKRKGDLPSGHMEIFTFCNF